MRRWPRYLASNTSFRPWQPAVLSVPASRALGGVGRQRRPSPPVWPAGTSRRRPTPAVRSALPTRRKRRRAGTRRRRPASDENQHLRDASGSPAAATCHVTSLDRETRASRGRTRDVGRRHGRSRQSVAPGPQMTHAGRRGRRGRRGRGGGGAGAGAVRGMRRGHEVTGRQACRSAPLYGRHWQWRHRSSFSWWTRI